MDLFGYSVGGGTYCLIYVYMPSGSLEDRLHCEVNHCQGAPMYSMYFIVVKNKSSGIKQNVSKL